MNTFQLFSQGLKDFSGLKKKICRMSLYYMELFTGLWMNLI